MDAKLVTKPDDIRRYLEFIAQVNGGVGRHGDVARFLLANGRSYPLTPKTFGGPRMRAKECFRNATLQAIEDGSMTYVEGIASWLIPFDHAWLADDQGVAIEPTLAARDRAHELSYFGVPFTREYVLERMKKAKFYGLLGPMSADPELLAGNRPDAIKKEKVP